MATQDEIVKIPAGMEKFFGGGGEMVRPSVRTVVTFVSQIPAGKVATVEALRSKIARKFDVHAACPTATMKSVLQAIDAKEQFCYWRLVKKGGQVIEQFPGGAKEHQRLLKQEGLAIDALKKVPVVKDFNSKLHVFK